VGCPLAGPADVLGSLQQLAVPTDQVLGSFGGVRRAAARDVGHAAEDHPAGDRAPDPVGHAQGVLDGEVHEVVGQLRPAVEPVEVVDDPVVALDDGVAAHEVGQAFEGDPHPSTMERVAPGLNRLTGLKRRWPTMGAWSTNAHSSR
jgi:hypothetical protein